MTGQSKPDLSLNEASELIAEVEASDREAARLAIASGVQAAQKSWIEAHLIAEALAVELLAVAEASHHSGKIAAYLRELASAVEAQTELH